MEENLLPWKFPWKSVEVDLFPWKFPWNLVEADLLQWKFVEASMEVRGSFHCRWKWKRPLLQKIAASTEYTRGSFHELLYTPTNFHLLPRVSQTSSSFHNNFIRVHQLPFDLLPWNFSPNSMETSMEVNLLSWKSVEADFLPWKFPWKLMEVDLLPWKYVEVSTIGGSGSFHCFHQLQLSRNFSV